MLPAHQPAQLPRLDLHLAHPRSPRHIAHEDELEELEDARGHDTAVAIERLGQHGSALRRHHVLVRSISAPRDVEEEAHVVLVVEEELARQQLVQKAPERPHVARAVGARLAPPVSVARVLVRHDEHLRALDGLRAAALP